VPVPRLRSLALAASLPLALVACASSSSPSSRGPAVTTATNPPTTGARQLTGHLTVFAAASLTGAFTAAKAGLAAADPGLALTYSFAGSNTLATQIQQGAPADVFAAADQANMQKLVTAGLVETPVVFARNKLEIAVAPGNPKHVRDLSDLARSDLVVVLEAKGVPAGDYTRQALSKQGITVTPKSLETDVKAAITKVGSGEADATVVYVTDVKAAGAKVSGVMIPDDQNVTATYPIAVVKATSNPTAAQAFVDSAVSGDVHKALEAAGFQAP